MQGPGTKVNAILSEETSDEKWKREKVQKKPRYPEVKSQTLEVQSKKVGVVWGSYPLGRTF